MLSTRKVVLGLAAAALASVSALAGPAGAVTPPVTGAGTVSCAAAGSLKFSPPLVNGGTATTETVTVAVNLNGCSGTGDGATVSQGKAVGSETLSTNDCAGVEAAPVSTLTATTTWKTTKHSPKLASTTVSASSGSASVNGSGKLQLSVSGSATGGSFSGDAASITAVISKSLSAIDKACASGKGLKSLTIDASGSSASLS